MTMRAIFACTAVVLLAGAASPAAGQSWRHSPGDWRETRRAIYELENRIALLEADPETDDGYKAPVIAKARTAIARLRASLGLPQWRWLSPCCYSRRPIHIR